MDGPLHKQTMQIGEGGERREAQEGYRHWGFCTGAILGLQMRHRLAPGRPLVAGTAGTLWLRGDKAQIFPLAPGQVARRGAP